MSLGRTFFLIVLLDAATSFVWADVRLAPLFQDHMVLQRDVRIPVWGHAVPGEQITVSFAGNDVSTLANSEGRWRLDLPALTASAVPRELTVRGHSSVHLISDVVVGEVWICSGQSNMAFTVREALNAEEELAAAHYPQLRHFQVALTTADRPSETVQGTWTVCSPETVGTFTAVGYFFGRSLHLDQGVPVGLIHSAWGGTFIESWMSEAVLHSNPAFSSVLKRQARFREIYPDAQAAYESDLKEWSARQAAARAAGSDVLVPRPREPIGPGHRNYPTALYNGMIAPLVPYSIRGFLWYQGEANGDRPEEYRALFAALIEQWRREWGQGELPFYFAQLSSFKAWNSADGDGWGYLREAQAQVLNLPNTGMAVTHDIGDPDDVHPRNKQEVARRLVLLALKRTYGRSVGVDSGPVLASNVRQGDAMVLTFDFADGLATQGDENVQGFEVAGPDRSFVPARAEIRDHRTIVVRGTGVSEPAAVQYAWRNVARGNLINEAGLPAGTFRTDDWQRGTRVIVAP
ncbi:MAG TPA: sialate O-acetylesterase [Opitutaceae bacterium]|nr:sialate O-acetylesterase [Opitutaceae bacterium]